MSIVVNSVTLTLGSTGTYVNPDGSTYPAKIILLQEAIPEGELILAATGVTTTPATRVDIRILSGNFQANRAVHDVRVVTDDLTVPNSFVPTPYNAAPAKPVGLNGVAASKAANLTWTATSGAFGYDVHRATDTGFIPDSANKVTSVTSPAYNDTGLEGTTQYYYKVVAKNAAGKSAASDQVSVTTLA